MAEWRLLRFLTIIVSVYAPICSVIRIRSTPFQKEMMSWPPAVVQCPRGTMYRVRSTANMVTYMAGKCKIFQRKWCVFAGGMTLSVSGNAADSSLSERAKGRAVWFGILIAIGKERSAAVKADRAASRRHGRSLQSRLRRASSPWCSRGDGRL